MVPEVGCGYKYGPGVDQASFFLEFCPLTVETAAKVKICLGTLSGQYSIQNSLELSHVPRISEMVARMTSLLLLLSLVATALSLPAPEGDTGGPTVPVTEKNEALLDLAGKISQC